MSSRITNDQSAISPSMNVQWSGKTLRISVRIAARAAEPVVQPAAQAAERAGTSATGIIHSSSTSLVMTWQGARM